MSIFPKRMVAGNTVTIHWNLLLPAGMEKAVCPFVRIGIKCPAGNVHMLFSEHVLLLPSTTANANNMQEQGAEQYLKKHTPLLILAAHLAGKQSREKLVEILYNIKSGRHYYFTWPVPNDAAPGKYTLLSEMHVDGSVKYSGTAAEDFFYVEQLEIDKASHDEAIFRNPGPEPVPVKLVSYVVGEHQRPVHTEVFDLKAGANRSINTKGKAVFLLYNEERITIPLHTAQKRPLRNQDYLVLRKEEGGEPVTYVLPREGEQGFKLTGRQQEIWEAADGMQSVEALRKMNSACYDELIANGLITELP